MRLCTLPLRDGFAHLGFAGTRALRQSPWLRPRCSLRRSLGRLIGLCFRRCRRRCPPRRCEGRRGSIGHSRTVDRNWLRPNTFFGGPSFRLLLAQRLFVLLLLLGSGLRILLLFFLLRPRSLVAVHWTGHAAQKLVGGRCGCGCRGCQLCPCHFSPLGLSRSNLLSLRPGLCLSFRLALSLPLCLALGASRTPALALVSSRRLRTTTEAVPHPARNHLWRPPGQIAATADATSSAGFCTAGG
mmetsp:Transcript_48909/g.124078  ORF Transcript_48909/g.124078 Transcript_48909/m.124078 type:complete len:242 (+) Transcript_48909:795-1520(+)